MMSLYNQGGVIVRKSQIEDIGYLAKRMRLSDILEIWASHNKEPFESLEDAYKQSAVCLSVLFDNEVVCMFGAWSDQVIARTGSIWMLSSDRLYEHGFRFVRHARRFVRLLQEFYPYLHNYVHANNFKSINMLKRIGAEIEEPKPYGLEGELFRHFYFELKQNTRGEICVIQ